MSITDQLAKVQGSIVCPKGQLNEYGGYVYRSCEDILDAAKKVLSDSTITLTDDLLQIGDRFYIKATATFSHKDNNISVTAFAREPDVKKGMDVSQITGSASSYARKYALGGLLAIDDNKDADSRDNRQLKTYNDTEKELFNKAVEEENALLLWALKGLLDEEVYIALHGSFPKGKITERKQVVRELEKAGHKEWNDLVHDVNTRIDSKNGYDLKEIVDELENTERKYLAKRLGKERTEQLRQLLSDIKD